MDVKWHLGPFSHSHMPILSHAFHIFMTLPHLLIVHFLLYFLQTAVAALPRIEYFGFWA